MFAAVESDVTSILYVTEIRKRCPLVFTSGLESTQLDNYCQRLLIQQNVEYGRIYPRFNLKELLAHDVTG